MDTSELYYFEIKWDHLGDLSDITSELGDITLGV